MKKLAGETTVQKYAGKLLGRLPGGKAVQGQLERIEQSVLAELKNRLEDIERTTSVSVLAVSLETDNRRSASAAKLLQDLLMASTEHTPAQAKDAYFISVLKNMVPDEARILSAVSDGSTYPLLNLMSANLIGMSARPVMENISNVGKAAGVQWLEMTPGYISRLRGWGLLDVDAEGLNPAQKTKYEILETDTALRTRVQQMEKAGVRHSIARRTLKITDAGLALWQACQVSEDR